MRVVAVAIAVADGAVRSMNDDLDVLALRLFTGLLEGLLLRVGGVADALRVPQTELLELPDCGHSPHRDQPDALITATTAFIQSNTTGDKRP